MTREELQKMIDDSPNVMQVMPQAGYKAMARDMLLLLDVAEAAEKFRKAPYHPNIAPLMYALDALHAAKGE